MGIVFAVLVFLISSYFIGELIIPIPPPEYRDGVGFLGRLFLGMVIEFCAVGAIAMIFVMFRYGIPGIIDYFFPKKNGNKPEEK
jgi:hypothetical protein